MKRLTTVILAIALIAFAATSCQKEGQYKPTKKVSTLTVKQKDKVIFVEFKWDKDKIVEQVEESNSISHVTTFSYDSKNRISEIKDYETRFSYIYDGKYLSKIEQFLNNTLVCTYNVIHENGYITRIDYTIFRRNKGEMDMNHIDPFFFLPSAVSQDMKASIQNSKSDADNYYIFTWNLKHELEEMLHAGNGVTRYNYTYDNKNNPFYGWLNTMSFDFDFMFSKHNVVKKRITNISYGDEKSVINYEYTYDGAYPTTQVALDENGIAQETTIFTYKE